MTAYEYDDNHKAFVKTCKCGFICLGRNEEMQSRDVFVNHFEFDNQTSDGFRALCRECTSNVRNKSRGVEVHNRRELLSKQNGICVICETKIEFNNLGHIYSAHVDHDSKTGKVRGILCAHCNRGLGLFKDDPNIAERAAQYLRGKL